MSLGAIIALTCACIKLILILVYGLKELDSSIKKLHLVLSYIIGGLFFLFLLSNIPQPTGASKKIILIVCSICGVLFITAGIYGAIENHSKKLK